MNLEPLRVMLSLWLWLAACGIIGLALGLGLFYAALLTTRVLTEEDER